MLGECGAFPSRFMQLHVWRGYLRLLSEQQRVLIIASIHQPRREVTRLFDELILLTKSPGRVVYQGPMSHLGDYLSEVLESALPAKVPLGMVSEPPSSEGKRHEIS